MHKLRAVQFNKVNKSLKNRPDKKNKQRTEAALGNLIEPVLKIVGVRLSNFNKI